MRCTQRGLGHRPATGAVHTRPFRPASWRGRAYRVCGLLGLLTANADAPHRTNAVTSALRCARHRGPDETGEWHDADVVLGFNRLSIIDLDHSHQPLRWGPPESPDRYALAFNGEIYNYLELRAELIAEFGTRFATEGDGEVIVAAYHHWG